VKVYSVELAGNFTIRISRAAEIVYPALSFLIFLPPFLPSFFLSLSLSLSPFSSFFFLSCFFFSSFFFFFMCYRSQHLVAGFSTVQQVRNEFHRSPPAAVY